MRRVKLFAWLMAMFMSVTLISGCSVVDVSEVFTVNNTKVTGGEYRFYLSVMKEMIASELGKTSSTDVNWDTDEIEGKKALEVAKQRAYDNLVENKVAAQEAKVRGLTISTDDKNSLSTSLLYSFSGKDKEQVLKDCEISDEVYNCIVEDIAYSQALSMDVLNNNTEISEISDEELRAKYDSKLEELSAKGTIKAKHILILFTKDDGTTRTEEEAFVEANRIKVLINDDNFDELVNQYSEDPGSKTYPDGYEFVSGDGQYVEEFDKGASALAIGQVSEPIKTSYGYHIIKRVPLLKDFADETQAEALKNEIKSDRFTAAYDELIEGLVGKANIVRDDVKYDKIK